MFYLENLRLTACLTQSEHTSLRQTIHLFSAEQQAFLLGSHVTKHPECLTVHFPLSTSSYLLLLLRLRLLLLQLLLLQHYVQ